MSGTILETDRKMMLQTILFQYFCLTLQYGIIIPFVWNITLYDSELMLKI